MISQEIQAEILTRHFNDKQSVRRIAFDLGLNRRSVKKIIRRRSVEDKRICNTPRRSIVDPFKVDVQAILAKDPHCTATAMFNRVRDLGYTGGMTMLRVYVNTIRQQKPRAKEAFLRLEFAPGSAAQVDWGEFGDVFHDGSKIHCFAMVLCHSRYLYIEFTRSEKFEDFIRCHENAFRYFGGAPRECWYDNLTSAVSDRAGSLVRFNARFMAYIGHHSIRPHACNVARGNEKGRVEDLIKYIRMNFWPARTFVDFDDLTAQATHWRNQIANQREHRSTRRIVRLMFEADEQKCLMPLNPNPYDTDETISKVVPPDFHIIYDTNRYSVPWTLVGMTVTLKINPEKITIYYHEQIVTTHQRSFRKGVVVTKEPHRTGLVARKPGGTRDDWQLAAVKNIGPKMAEYVDLLKAGHRSLRSELSKILALSTIYGDHHVHEAVWTLLERGIIGAESLEITLKSLHHPADANLNLEPINFTNQKLNRNFPVVDLRRYDALLFEQNNNSAPDPSEENHGSKHN